MRRSAVDEKLTLRYITMNTLSKKLGIAFLMLGCSSAESEIHFPFESWGWDDSVERVIPSNFLSISSIEIGTSTLEDAKREFGAAAVYRPGTESYLPSLICYLSDSDETAVIFQSGPLGGWSVVTAIWVGNSNYVDESKCATSSKVKREKDSGRGVFLGSRISAIESELGEPTFAKLPFVAFRFQYKDVGRTDGPFDISSGIEMEIEDGRVVWFRVYKEASN
jgi:hypothetical protein